MDVDSTTKVRLIIFEFQYSHKFHLKCFYRDIFLFPQKKNTVLHIASLAGKEDLVKLLIERGAQVNVQNQKGFTPLYMAAQNNFEALVKFLIASGADQNLGTVVSTKNWMKLLNYLYDGTVFYELFI